MILCGNSRLPWRLVLKLEDKVAAKSGAGVKQHNTYPGLDMEARDFLLTVGKYVLF